VWWADLRSLLGPVLSYWAAVGIGMGCFTGLWGLAIGFVGDDGQVVAALVSATALGTALGQACALLRVRTWVVLGIAVATYGSLATLVTASVMGDARDAGVLLVVVGMFLPFFAVAGLLSLRTSVLSVFALFTPLTWIVASILLAAEQLTPGAANWLAGDKLGIWNALTAPILALGVGLSVGYLALRERHRLRRWMTARAAGDEPTIRRVRGSSLRAAAGGCGSLLATAVLVLAVSFGTGLLSPYLFRSAPADDGPPVEQPDPAPAPAPEPRPSSGQDWEKAEQIAQQVGRSLLFLLLLVLLTVVGGLVFGPPGRRSVAMELLRHPPPTTPPSERVASAWRLCEVALADAGVERFPGDTAAAQVARAREKLPAGLNLESLAEVAQIADRARFGLGLDPQDELRARRHAEMAYQSVWEVLSELDRIRAIYRWSL
jgi:hypothetical protein